MSDDDRPVIRHCSCGRPVLANETHEEWAAAEKEHHGPPPQRVLDLVARMKANAQKRSA